MRLSVSELSSESRCWAVDPGRKPGRRLQEPDPGPGPDPDLALGQWVSSGEFSVSDDLRNAITVAKGVRASSAEVHAYTPFAAQLFDLDTCAQRLSHTLLGVWSQQAGAGGPRRSDGWHDPLASLLPFGQPPTPSLAPQPRGDPVAPDAAYRVSRSASRARPGVGSAFLCLPIRFCRTDMLRWTRQLGDVGSGGPSLRAGQQQRRLLAILEAAGPWTRSRLPPADLISWESPLPGRELQGSPVRVRTPASGAHPQAFPEVLPPDSCLQGWDFSVTLEGHVRITAESSPASGGCVSCRESPGPGGAWRGGGTPCAPGPPHPGWLGLVGPVSLSRV